MKYLYDTNVFLSYLTNQGKADYLFEQNFLERNTIVTSRIVRMELLSYSFLKPNDERVIENLLHQFNLLPLTRELEDIAIYFRRKYNLKIPDAIIAATAYSVQATIITFDVKNFKKLSEINIINP